MGVEALTTCPGAAGFSPSAATRQRLRELSKEEWNRLPQERKTALRTEWAAMDADGSESVTRQELQEWMQRKGIKAPQAYLDSLYALVDVDGSGKLDFWEVGALLFVMRSCPSLGTCDKCHDVVLDEQVCVCPICATLCQAKRDWRGKPPPAGYGHFFCNKCAAEHTAKGLHHHKLFRVPNEYRRPYYQWEGLQGFKVPCQSCHMEHQVAACGYLCPEGTHMWPAPSGQGFVCEMCCTRTCGHCGGVQWDLARPEQHGWAKPLPTCGACQGRPERKGPTWFEPQTLAKSAARLHCEGCRTQALDGSLHARRHGTPPPQAPQHAPASHQPRAAPQPQPQPQPQQAHHGGYQASVPKPQWAPQQGTSTAAPMHQQHQQQQQHHHQHHQQQVPQQQARGVSQSYHGNASTTSRGFASGAGSGNPVLGVLQDVLVQSLRNVAISAAGGNAGGGGGFGNAGAAAGGRYSGGYGGGGGLGPMAAAASGRVPYSRPPMHSAASWQGATPSPAWQNQVPPGRYHSMGHAAAMNGGRFGNQQAGPQRPGMQQQQYQRQRQQEYQRQQHQRQQQQQQQQQQQDQGQDQGQDPWSGGAPGDPGQMPDGGGYDGSGFDGGFDGGSAFDGGSDFMNAGGDGSGFFGSDGSSFAVPDMGSFMSGGEGMGMGGGDGGGGFDVGGLLGKVPGLLNNLNGGGDGGGFDVGGLLGGDGAMGQLLGKVPDMFNGLTGDGLLGQVGDVVSGLGDGGECTIM